MRSLRSIMNQMLIVDFSVKAKDESFVAYGQFQVHGKFYYPADTVFFATAFTVAHRVQWMKERGELEYCALGYDTQFNSQMFERRQTNSYE